MKTADLVDDFADELTLCDCPFLKFGQKPAFYGPVHTVKCFEDNALLKSELEKPGDGRVMIVDGGGSSRKALIGDMIAAILIKNGWAGIIIYGAIRDSADIDKMDIGVRCLATSPVKSTKQKSGFVGSEVCFGDAVFKPGDCVYADADGVLVARRSLL